MIRKKLMAFPAIAIFALLAASCSSDPDFSTEPETVSATFHIGLDPQTRAAQSLNLNNYDAKLYLYEGREDSEGLGYVQVQEIDLESNNVTIENLTAKTRYKAVFMAVPKNQQPALPDLMKSGIVPSYDLAAARYINEDENQTENNIFRSVVSFTANTNESAQSTVLTRQNGAVEIRIINTPGIKSAELHVEGRTEMLLNDGTGGQVLTDGGTVALSKVKNDDFEASDVRIRINLLPEEDITDADGNKNYLTLNMTDGTIRKYPLKSDQDIIPIYPNQVTWLTIGNGAGNFSISFSGLNLDDDKWDGWSF